MSTPVRIFDPKDAKYAQLFERNKKIGQIVYTDELQQYDQFSTIALNDELGFEMAINAAFSGTPEIVHVGTSDGIYWTGSNITGTKASFDSTEQKYSGVASVKIDNPNLNDVWQFDKGSTLDPSNYIAISLWLYVDKDWSVGDSIEIYGWDTGVGLAVGTAVLLQDYVNEFDFDVWQKVIIPLDDFAFSGGTFDALRMELIGKNGKAPKMYIDDFQFEEAGALATFSMKPRNGETFFVEAITLSFQDAYTGTLTGNSFKNLSPNKILSENKLTNGIQLNRIQDGETAFSATITCLSDAIQGGATIGDLFGDGTNAMLTLNITFSKPVELNDKDEDELNIVISDDLTGLTSFTALARGWVEVEG